MPRKVTQDTSQKTLSQVTFIKDYGLSNSQISRKTRRRAICTSDNDNHAGVSAKINETRIFLFL